MSEANCGNCRFWKRGYDSSGGCRRHAPRPFTPGRANWAGTEETEWCGEHQPIEAIEHSEPVKEGSETNFESHEAMFDSVGNLLSEAIKEYQSCIVAACKELALAHQEWASRIEATKTEPDTEKKPARYREPTNEDIGREVEMRDGESEVVDYWTQAKLVCVLEDATKEGRFVADWDGDYFVFKEARILCGGEVEE